MKYKNKVAWLQTRQKWFDSLSKKDQASMTRPGSVKCN